MSASATQGGHKKLNPGLVTLNNVQPGTDLAYPYNPKDCMMQQHLQHTAFYRHTNDKHTIFGPCRMYYRH